MKRFTCMVLVAALLAGSSSLGAQQQAGTVERSPDYWFAYAEKLAIGSTVRVRTSGGDRYTAVLAIVDREGITLEMKTRIPEPPRRVPYSRLEQLELKQNGTSAAKAAIIGVATGAATFFGILLILAAAYSD